MTIYARNVEYKKHVLLAAFFVPVIVDAFFTYLPYMEDKQPEGGAFLSALVIGVLILTQYKGNTTKETAVVIALSVPMLLLVVFGTSMYVSCFNGDCL